MQGVPVSAAISAQRLAVLSVRSGHAVLATYLLESGTPEASVECGVEPYFSSVSFSGPERLLLIAWSEPSVTEITFSSGRIVLGGNVRLRGQEIDRSIASAHKQAAAAGNAQGREKLVLAHLTARNGNDLFFFGPFNRAEGFRLGEFNRQGNQVASYRLKEDQLPAGKARINQSLMSAGSESVTFLRPDGVALSFMRP